MHLIGLDLGTTGCKAIVFDAEGRAQGQAFREYQVICDAPAKAEQDANQVWVSAKEVLREAVARSGPTQVRALSVSVQGDAIIPVDREFDPLHPAILGMDYRSAPQARLCEEKFGAFELFQRTGMRPHPLNSLAKLLWLRDTAPNLLTRAWRVVTYADFILGRLGGGAVLDHTMASRTMAFNLATRTWDTELHRALDLDPNLWSPAAPSGTPAGHLRAPLAAELGLPKGLLLLAGGHDQTCAALGAGVVGEGRGVVSTGTAEVLSTAFRQPALTRTMFAGFYPCYLHAKAGMFFTFALNHVGGLLLRWWRDQFATAEVADAPSGGTDPYHLMDERMPDGLSPLLVVPHLNGSGTPTCDLEARGAILGLTLATTRHDVAKALLESLCFELLQNLETLQSAGVRVEELVAVGGGAKSERWLQLKADVLGRPIRTLRCREAACWGAALLAGAGAGVFRSLEDAAARTVAFHREYEPRPDRTALYRERYAAYRPAVAAVREVHRKL
jgi:xylulokinase